MQGADRDSHLSVPTVPDDLLRPVIAHFQPRKVILFGSQARGDAGDDSDYDLFVIVEDDTPPERLSWQSKYEARRTYHRAVDIVAERFDAGIRVGYVWFLVLGLSVYIPWFFLTLLGGFLGNLIGDPRAIGIDVLLPIYFMGLVLGFRSRANWLPVVLASSVGSILALHFVGSPWHVSLGALAGIAVAALMPIDGEESAAPIGDAIEGEA